MIKSFSCKETEKLFNHQKTRRIPAKLQTAVLERLQVLDAAIVLTDLYFPPSNGLKKVKGRESQYELRVNNRYRIYFQWLEDNAHKVQFGDHL